MTQVKNININYTDEYGVDFPRATAYIYAYEGSLTVGGKAGDGDTAYQKHSMYTQFTYQVNVACDEKHKQAILAKTKRSRPALNEEDEENPSLVFSVDMDADEIAPILSSSLDHDEKVSRCCVLDFQMRQR